MPLAFGYTRDELNEKKIGELKSIARENGVHGFAKFTRATKQQLADKIWDVCVLSRFPEDPDTPPKKGEPWAPPKKATPVEPPKKVAPVEPPKKVELTGQPYDFNPEDILPITINLGKRPPSAPSPSGLGNITPDILLAELEKPAFVQRVVESLRGIYAAKTDVYKKLLNKVGKQLTDDIEEKRSMMGVVDSQELQKMFPMIPINQALKVKFTALVQLARVKTTRLYGPGVAALVKQDLIEAVTNEDDGILSISGERRADIRNQLCRQIFILSKGYRPFMNSFLNMVFTGPAGVGKTKLANAVGFIYKQSGILLKGDVIVVSPKDMVGEYVGQTAPKAAGVLMKGLEGIVFIDEAYQIMPCQDGKLQTDTRSYGPEAITEIVNFLDKFVGLSIMIVAGYKTEIDGCFFAANEGLQRRFPVRMVLPPYTMNDLLNIFLKTAIARLDDNIFSPDIAKYIYTVMVQLDAQDEAVFRNQAGDIMNLVSTFLNAYYGSINVEWGSFDNDVIIVNAAFNRYLSSKGLIMTLS